MKKSLLLLFALLTGASLSFAAKQSLPLGSDGDLGSGSNSTYDAATKTITFTGTNWGQSRGWWFGTTGDFSAYTQVVVDFVPVTYSVKLVVQYGDGSNNNPEVYANAGANQIVVDLDPALSNSVEQVYLQCAEAGTLTLVDAYFTDGKSDAAPSSILDFESDTLNTVYPSVAYYPTDITAVVAENPAPKKDLNGDGIIDSNDFTTTDQHALHVTATNYNAYPKFHIILPDNKKVSDIERISLDIYFNDNGSSQNNYKNMDYFVGASGTSMSPTAKTGSATNLIGSSEATGVWLSKIFLFDQSNITADVLDLNEFDFAMGISNNPCDYYLDNITFVLNSGEVVTGTSVDFTFEDNAMGDEYIATGGVATIVDNPAPTADNLQSLYYKNTNYDQLITLGTVEVPEGYTLADCQSISFDVYTTASQSKELLIKIGDNALWGNGIYKKVSNGGSWGTVSVNPITGETTDADGGQTAKSGSKGGTSVYTDGSLTSFTLAVGVGDNAIDYYLDNVILTFSNPTGVVQVKPAINNAYGVTGGIVVNAVNEKVSVYGIDGRLVKQTVVDGYNTSIPMTQGVYIVKVGLANPVKVVVK